MLQPLVSRQLGSSTVFATTTFLFLFPAPIPPKNALTLLGVDFKAKMMTLENTKTIKLTVWDTAGQERFRTLTSSYYRGAHGVILVYDVTSKPSFDAVRGVWLQELRTYASPDEMVLMVVGNKVDKQTERQVNKEEGQKMAKDLSALYMECSAKTRVGIQAAFEDLVHAVIASGKMAVKEGGRANRRLLTVTSEDDGSAEEGASSLCAC